MPAAWRVLCIELISNDERALLSENIVQYYDFDPYQMEREEELSSTQSTSFDLAFDLQDEVTYYSYSHPFGTPEKHLPTAS